MNVTEKFPVLVAALRVELNSLESEFLTPEKIRDLVEERGQMLAAISKGLDNDAKESIARYFEQQFEVVQSKPCPWQLHHQHDLVESWKPFIVLVEEVGQVVSTTFRML